MRSTRFVVIIVLVSVFFAHADILPAGMEFISIEGGRFLMGSDMYEDYEHYFEEPHWVTVGSFEIMTTEVTQEMYIEVLGERANHSARNIECRHFPRNLPVENVTWEEVQEFIDALNSTSPGYIYNLPTEAQWEYACRAGSTTPYYWGSSASRDIADLYCWNQYNSDDKTHPVAEKLPNAWGLYDLIGNVAEFVHGERYGPNPTRGGNAFAPNAEGYPSRIPQASELLSPARQDSGGMLHTRYKRNGFRVVRVPH